MQKHRNHACDRFPITILAAAFNANRRFPSVIMPEIARRLYSNAYVMLAMTMLAWGAHAVVARVSVGEISPMMLTSGRWLLVSLLLATFYRAELGAALTVLRAHPRYMLLMGALGYTAFNVMMYLAAQFTTAVNMSLLQGAIPIFVLIGAFIAYRIPVRGVQIIGVGVTVLGVVLTATNGHPERLRDLVFNIGDVLMIIACAFYAGYTVKLKERPAVPSIVFFAALALVAGLVSLPFLAIEIALGKAQAPTLTGWAVLAFVGVIPSFLAQISFMRGVELIGPGRAGIFANLVPVIGAGLAVLFLAEPFGWHHGLALVLVLGGIAIAERGRGA
jgi:drug/metabolite transporter (DMT)-like permease